LASIPDHTTYAGVVLDWGIVYNQFGQGIYRLKVETIMKELQGCLVSEKFRLLAWDCLRAHGTVKFEAWVTGKIGDKYTQGKIFDLCGFYWYDSVRLRGLFGYETTPEYLEIKHEYQNGLQERIKDEALQRYEYRSGYYQKYLHDRFKIYGMMSDKLLVSDYNNNNSDYQIKRKPITKGGAYEPEYLDKQRRRLSKVTVIFEEGQQSVIKSICCDLKEGAIG
jgi:hypothetical protein